MPDLGKYADTVMAAYGIALLLLVALIVLSLLRAQKVKKQLSELEQRRKNNG